jgi:probable F420-dependent oxidoreductase
VKFAIRQPGSLLYRSLTSPWEATLTPGESLHFARRVDALDFDYLWVSEHVIQAPALVKSMGGRFYEAVSAAAVLLGATQRVELLTYVAVLPYHNPLSYAKAIATVDLLSGGRIAMGLACGHLEPEFRALGVPFAERGARSDEYLKIMKELWTAERPRFHGRFFDFEDVVFEPKPLRRPHPPLFIGGDARPVQRRAANLGDGWIPWLTLPEELPERLAYIRGQPGMARRATPFEVYMLLADFPADDRGNLSRFRIPKRRDEVTRQLERLQQSGATGAIVHLPPGTSGLDECLEWVEWFSREIIPAFRGRERTGGEG